MGTSNQFFKLFLQEECLCNDLGIQPLGKFANPVPSEQLLDEFEAYIKEKSNENVRHL